MTVLRVVNVDTARAGETAGLTYTLAWLLADLNDETLRTRTPEERYVNVLAWLDQHAPEEARSWVGPMPRRESVSPRDAAREVCMTKGTTAQATGLGCCLFLLLVALVVWFSGLFWGWILMLCLGSAHAVAPPWGYWQCVLPWGLVCGLVFGALTMRAGVSRKEEL